MLEEVKVCPLLSVGRTSDPAQCLGDRCAWWNYPGCILFGVVEELGSIAASLDDVTRAIKKTALDATNIQSGNETQQDA